MTAVDISCPLVDDVDWLLMFLGHWLMITVDNANKIWLIEPKLILSTIHLQTTNNSQPRLNHPRTVDSPQNLVSEGFLPLRE